MNFNHGIVLFDAWKRLTTLYQFERGALFIKRSESLFGGCMKALFSSVLRD
jgi:hypothetical protein